ncbi:hypothetical protein WJX74_003098 [Apatococcus lobatus]|uniref:Uncharacterized protein n=1 Tax=Apatococcus lobatus TaxID=904363 RepID=A0AAW1SG08_9CHLO
MTTAARQGVRLLHSQAWSSAPHVNNLLLEQSWSSWVRDLQESCSALWQHGTESLWLAVPKRKVSPHRRGLRNLHNKWERVQTLSQCGVCGRVLQIHAVPKPNKQCKQDFPEYCPTLNPSRLWGAGDAAEEAP